MSSLKVARSAVAGVFLLFSCVAAGLPTPPQHTLTPDASPPSTASPDPYQLYSESVRAMRAAHKAGTPPYLVYKLSCEMHNLELKPASQHGGTTDLDVKLVHANHHYDYVVWYRTRDDRALSQDQSTHQQFNSAIFNPGSLSDDDASPSPSASATPASAQNSMVPTPSLGSISVYGNRDYQITFVGLEPLDGNSAFHLHLRAKHSDRDHPLTDVWIDPVTKLMRKASASISYRAVALGGGGNANVFFGQVGKYWMMTGFDFHAAMYALLWHANIGGDIRATDVTMPASLPDSYFPATPAP